MGLGFHILFLSVYFGIPMGLFLLFVKSYKSKANIFLGVLILFFTTYSFPHYLFRIGQLENLPHAVKIGVTTGFLLGPLTFFYIKTCTQKDFKFTKWSWLHLLPFIADTIFHIPFYMMSGAEKLEIYNNLFYNGIHTELRIVQMLRAVSIITYTLLGLRLVFNYREHLSNTTSAIDKNYYKWLMLFCFIILFPLIFLILFAFTRFDIVNKNIIVLGFLLPILSTFFAALFKPEIFHSFPHQMPEPESAEEQKKKYETSTLQEKQKDKFTEKLLAFVKTEKPYQESELTIADLAERVNIPTHYLSQTINEKLNCTFLDFINEYRVEEAKLKLRDENYENYTIIAIAYEAGFNSKTAFYTAFKKFTGTTPSQYRKLGKMAA